MSEHEVSSRWLLASALQKSIRRGKAGLAHDFAARLLEVNPSYLTFRLGVVALEDVGPACWELVGEVYEAIRERTRPAFTDLAARMASSPKSRSVCHASALEPLDTLDLPPLPRFLTSYGKGFEKLGLAVPRVWHMVENADVEIVENRPDEFGDEMIAGLPACAIDKHTREGKLAIRHFVKALGTTFTEEQIGYAVFRVEGAHLDRELVFDGSEGLKIADVEGTYRRLGLTSREHMLEVAELIRQNRELLNRARRRVLEG